ncbi:acyltransferase family protein [Mucilaginibacter phyllosphaerae]|uniref:Acyltransferase n=1 Tax=Mucilaginibacter phyllosphaerae TaxID=1812349 RepID=A0A4Y8AI49_9SPHI|nr:acyltransferase [Mucilaginibacter phyllosphaerae]MBB3968544.1 peptidoglycan/LPS O-acetylase OafA/YrhL [Mucilaginibacter phyllosphaerae]TEW67815.1 acyltransferase [Mucilaginibacter phyllosphaerae]GGH15355.1 acyltransferase [Mucilaginibacter phyllosphaerae]
MLSKIWKALGLHLYIDTNRVYGLDILRAFAILSVVVIHQMIYTPSTLNKIIEATYLDGVSIFFVLSGFLIGSILIKLLNSPNITFYTLLNFWWRRWLRTIPAYYVTLSALIIAYNYNKPPGPTFKRFYIFTQNLFTPHPGFFLEAWSLSVEEWFYLTIPFALFILVKILKIKVPASVIIISITIIAFSTILRIERYFDNLSPIHLKDPFLFRQVVTRLDSIMYGMLAAYIAYYKNDNWLKNKRYKLITGILILMINKVLTQLFQTQYLLFYNTALRFTFDAIGTALMLPYLSTYRHHGKGVIFKIITYISLISYSMYLINFTPMQEYIIPFINRHLLGFITDKGILKNVNMVLSYLLIIPLSIYSYKLIESPFIKLRNSINFGKKLPAPVA